MKKSKKALIAVLAVASMVVPTSAGVSAALPPDSGIASPNYVGISSADISLTKKNAEELKLYGNMAVRSGYTCGMTAELQKYDGSWQTIATWYATGKLLCSMDQTWGYNSSYTYRLKITYKAYNSSGTCVDSIVKYSKEV